MSLKEAAKAQFTTAVATEASAQVEDDVIDKEEGEPDKQYTAIKIDYETVRERRDFKVDLKE